MAISIPRLRRWFVVAGATMLALVFFFYARTRWRMHNVKPSNRGQVARNLLQSSQGFTYSKSEGGRTLFTVHAKTAEEFKDDKRVALTDVGIIVYGKKADRFDQITGHGFDYDPANERFTARGEVAIDLQGVASTEILPDQATPRELKDPIHLRTSGLVFDRKSGQASTAETLAIDVPQARGSARGVLYDGRDKTLSLEHDILLEGNGPNHLRLSAASGLIRREPRQIELTHASFERGGQSIVAQHMELALDEHNQIAGLIATGDVTLHGEGRTPLVATAQRCEVAMADKEQIREAHLSGGVQLRGDGDKGFHGAAGAATLRYGRNNKLESARAEQGVHLLQPAASAKQQSAEIISEAIDFKVVDGRVLRQAQSSGAAKILLRPASGVKGSQTTIVAKVFRAEFDDHSRLNVLQGEGGAKIVESLLGGGERTSISQRFTVEFAQGGGVYSIIQEGDVRYVEPAHGATSERKAWAARAVYTTDDESLSLYGSPRMVDSGAEITAQTIRLNRRTGDAFAQGGVKSTYTQRKLTNGGLLASGEPVHVTARNMSAQRASGIARYTGDARLWQSGNAVQAAAIEYDSQHRTLTAESGSTPGAVVHCLLADAKGQAMHIASQRLSYFEMARKARFTGGVEARSGDRLISSARAELLLRDTGSGAARVEQLTAEGGVQINDTARQANGEKLICAGADNHCTLSGGEPTLRDAQYGSIKGDSLTFFRDDDRVIVDSRGGSRVVTRTRAKH